MSPMVPLRDNKVCCFLCANNGRENGSLYKNSNETRCVSLFVSAYLDVACSQERQKHCQHRATRSQSVTRRGCVKMCVTQ